MRTASTLRGVLVVASVILTSACHQRSTEPTPPPCSYAVSKTTLAFPASGGADTVTVDTAGGCAWTAASTTSWLTVTAGAAGSGPGAVQVAAAANGEATARQGSLLVAGLVVTAAQAAATPGCAFALDRQADHIGPGRADGTITVTTDAGCTWQASSDAAWLRVTSGSSGAGPGVIAYTAERNDAVASRIATIHAAGLAFVLEQDGDVSGCSYQVSPVLLSPCMTWPGTVPIAVTTSESCPWSASTSAPWIDITAGASGQGSGVIQVTGTENFDAPRSGLVMVRWPTVTAGQNVQVQQAGCRYGVSPASLSFAAAGGAGQFMVVQQSDPIACGGPLQDRCQWTAVADVPWIAITTTMPRVGDDRVTLTVAANPSIAARTGRVVVRDQVVVITQAGS